MLTESVISRISKTEISDSKAGDGIVPGCYGSGTCTPQPDTVFLTPLTARTQSVHNLRAGFTDYWGQGR